MTLTVHDNDIYGISTDGAAIKLARFPFGPASLYQMRTLGVGPFENYSCKKLRLIFPRIPGDPFLVIAQGTNYLRKDGNMGGNLDWPVVISVKEQDMGEWENMIEWEEPKPEAEEKIEESKREETDTEERSKEEEVDVEPRPESTTNPGTVEKSDKDLKKPGIHELDLKETGQKLITGCTNQEIVSLGLVNDHNQPFQDETRVKTPPTTVDEIPTASIHQIEKSSEPQCYNENLENKSPMNNNVLGDGGIQDKSPLVAEVATPSDFGDSTVIEPVRDGIRRRSSIICGRVSLITVLEVVGLLVLVLSVLIYRWRWTPRG